ncbi:phosphomannose isomerase type II C-terminal cupin domain [Lusitaniella coriacea LEGE 07157]|uniref:Phosphomannose isomerase type II C-terminal cupin domain n=1 Tax=Lusitaniella coriacea LEGE 07157 TaxID=945747 RepID=A0A8J7APD3_9CYAN|nr:phosphomannose isomerase type II C-terminal cupin domain [Lusitaniella coriacea]MBE9115488.1 phosphomannose isomerase type II C-terminal cupin domain [Lusitaniella coriacea LEGE 07157]
MSNAENNGKTAEDTTTISAQQAEAEHETEKRPWGKVTMLEEGERYRINRIEVNPGEHISTQMHYHRSEHWIVVAGTAKVIFDGEDHLLMQKQSTYVPMNTTHRVENPGVIPLVMIEVQNGEYLGDDDIIRLPEDTIKA